MANRTIALPPKVDPLSPEDRSWATKNLDRQERLERDIKYGTFDPMKYVYDVRPNKCL